MIWFWYGFSKGQRGCNDIKIVYISNFSQFRSRGGGHRKSIFSQIQKSPNYPRGGGGQENYGLFPQIMVFFILNRPLSLPNKPGLNLGVFKGSNVEHPTWRLLHYDNTSSFPSDRWKIFGKKIPSTSTPTVQVVKYSSYNPFISFLNVFLK